MAALTPPDFEVPVHAELGAFVFEPLMIGDVIADYDAVMTSVDHIAHTFGPNATWPNGLTLEQNLIDLGWHHKEFQRRTSFAYKVLEGGAYTGCAYIYPSAAEGFDAVGYGWVRQSRAELDGALFQAFAGWLRDAWPFAAVAFPGRTQSWDAWRALAKA